MESNNTGLFSNEVFSLPSNTYFTKVLIITWQTPTQQNNEPEIHLHRTRRWVICSEKTSISVVPKWLFVSPILKLFLWEDNKVCTQIEILDVVEPSYRCLLLLQFSNWHESLRIWFLSVAYSWSRWPFFIHSVTRCDICTEVPVVLWLLRGLLNWQSFIVTYFTWEPKKCQL